MKAMMMLILLGKQNRLDSPEMMENTVIQRASVLSNVFQVYSAKNFPGMAESTALSRLFADQGLKIRVRKETRASKYGVLSIFFK
jgi:hypothetical protein